jgi:hypothetical protein
MSVLPRASRSRLGLSRSALSAVPVVGDLLTAEISERQTQSIRYQITIPKLPLAKDFDDLAFDDISIKQTLVYDLARGKFVVQHRNVLLVGGEPRRVSRQL